MTMMKLSMSSTFLYLEDNRMIKLFGTMRRMESNQLNPPIDALVLREQVLDLTLGGFL